MSENKVNHPNHYAGSSAESWDLTVLEWGPEYAMEKINWKTGECWYEL